jgi:hypothetical protein
MTGKKYLYGLFEDEEILIKAVKNVRAEGLKIDNCFTPFPVHGLDDAMGLRQTKIHTAGFIFGATGTLTALTFMIWVNVKSFPMNFGGKPFLSLPAYIPITFELTVLFASVGMVLLYMHLNRLAPGMPAQVLDERTTSHLFAMSFEVDEEIDDSKQEEIKNLLMENGAVEVSEKSFDAG